MSTRTIALLGGGWVLAIVVAWYAWTRPLEAARPPSVHPRRPVEPAPATVPRPRSAPAVERSGLIKAGPRIDPTARHERVDQIKRDYEEVRAKAAADYAAAGAAFPGGLNAFLRQLALLEREKRHDLARVLSPLELEDAEMEETPAGQLVSRLLAEAPIANEQRRAVFRLQRAYEERFALTFDLAPKALYEREAARQALQERIRTVLGDDVFPLWLRGEGDEFAQFTAFARRQGLPGSAALELWRSKNDFALVRLQLMADHSGARAVQLRSKHAALTHQIEGRVLRIVGPGLMDRARHEVLGWLPKK